MFLLLRKKTRFRKQNRTNANQPIITISVRENWAVIKSCGQRQTGLVRRQALWRLLSWYFTHVIIEHLPWEANWGNEKENEERLSSSLGNRNRRTLLIGLVGGKEEDGGKDK